VSLDFIQAGLADLRQHHRNHRSLAPDPLVEVSSNVHRVRGSERRTRPAQDALGRVLGQEHATADNTYHTEYARVAACCVA